MSSISPSDRANTTDEIRRIREDYENKEAENTKKRNKEIRSLNEKQDQELSKVHEEYNDQVETLRNKHAEMIDDRDKRHTDDISKMRGMYVESLRKKTVDEVRNRDAEKSAFEGDLKKEKQISSQQREVAERGFRQSLSERDRVLEDRQDRGAVILQKSIEDRTDKLNAKHEEEMKVVVDDRDRRVGDLGHSMQEMKSTFDDRLSSAERANRAETDRRTSNFENIYRNQEHNNAQLISNRDALLTEENHQLHEKFDNKMHEEDDKMTKLRERYAEQMDARGNAYVREAKSEASRAKNDQVLEAVTNRRLRDIDHNHLQGAYQARENDLQRQKDEVFGKVNEVARERVNTVIDRTDKLVSESNRRNRMEQDIQSMRTREALAQQENTSKDQLQMTNNRADTRMRKIIQSSNLAQKNQIRQHEENLDDLRRNYGDNLQNQREAQLDSMKTIYSRMDQKLRDLEAHLMKKHDDAVEFYEEKIDGLEAQNKQDTQRMNQTFDARSAQREKAFKMEEESLTKKFEQKLAIQEDIHQKDMNRLEKRHQEQMQAVAARAAAASSKKV